MRWLATAPLLRSAALGVALLGCGARTALTPGEDLRSGGNGGGSAAAPTDADPKPESGCVHKLAVGGTHACALRTDGSLWCWGNDASGQCGDVLTQSDVAQVASLGGDVVDVAAGLQDTCVILQDGSVRCFGSNTFSQLGPSGGVDLDDVIAVSVGGTHVCALAAGGVFCWGNIGWGALGVGELDSTEGWGMPTPQRVTVLDGRDVVELAAGNRQCCARERNGTAWCWGNGHNPNGENYTWLFSPTPVLGLPAATQLASGEWMTCAVTRATAVHCWQANTEGAADEGAEPTYAARMEVPPGLEAGARAVAVGTSHRCAALLDGSVWCWGTETSGEMGTAQPASPAPPTLIEGLDEPVVQIGAGHFFSCALTETGKVWCWGDNGHEQLARPWQTVDHSAVPLEVEIPCP